MPTPTSANRAYQKPIADNKLNQDVARLVAALDAIDADVHSILTAALTIAGVKTFASSPIVPTPAAGDNSTKAANTAFVHAAIAALLNSSPATLDTLNELAAALGNDPNFATTMATALASKADAAATTTALAGKAASSHTHAIADITALAAAIAGKPAFSAYLNSTQTVSNGVATKITLNAETFDTDSCFDATTNYRFQPNVAGYYFFTGRLTGAAATSGTVMNAHLYKNGTLIKNGQPYIPPSGSSSMTVTISGLVYLNGSTDYVELWGTNSGSGTNTFSAGAAASFFDGHFVRPA